MTLQLCERNLGVLVQGERLGDVVHLQGWHGWNLSEAAWHCGRREKKMGHVEAPTIRANWRNWQLHRKNHGSTWVISPRIHGQTDRSGERLSRFDGIFFLQLCVMPEPTFFAGHPRVAIGWHSAKPLVRGSEKRCSMHDETCSWTVSIMIGSFPTPCTI